MYSQTRLTFCLLALIVTVGGPATTRAEAEADAAPEAAGGIQEVVVTARKRAESTQDVPVSVTALSAEQIQQYDLTSLEKIAASEPQFQVGRAASGSGARLTLRGIGSSSSSIGIEQSVAVVVDDVYYGQGRTIDEGFFDLAGAEILKGPQALFFGKNATAGVVSLTTADPTDSTERVIKAGYEFTSESVYGEGVVSGKVTDDLGLRIALRGTRMFGGYYTDDASAVNYATNDAATGIITNHFAPVAQKNVPGGGEGIGRITGKWKPLEPLTITLKASFDRNDDDDAAANYVRYYCPKNNASQINQANPCGHNFTIYQNDIPSDIAATLPFAGDGSLGDYYSSWGTTLTANYALDHLNLTSVNNYNWNKNVYVLDGDFGSSNTTGVNATEDTTFSSFSTEERALTTYDGPLNGMLGIYYQKSVRDYSFYNANGGAENSAAPPDLRYVQIEKLSATDGQTVSGFGQVTWKFLPTLEVAAGARVTHETKDSFFIQPYVNPRPAAAGTFAPGVLLTKDQVFNNTSPEATVTWKPQDNVTAFVAYKTAYKSGGFSNSGNYPRGGTVDSLAFGPEKAEGFEAGLKTTSFERQLLLDLGIYTYRYTDLQVDFFNAPTFAFITENAGAARVRGVELETQYAPRDVSGLNFHGTANYNKARYVDFLAPCWAGQSIAAGCNLIGPAPARTQLQNLSGFPLAVAPLWTASLGTSYEKTLPRNLSITFAVDGRYSSDYLASGFGNPYSRQASFGVLDSQISLKTQDDRWELSVIGKNLTNTFYVTGQVDAPSTGSGTGTASALPADQIGYAGLPRTVQLQLTTRF
jgi:iron complex outermembrane recepter protein